MTKAVFISKLFSVDNKYYVVILLNSKQFCLECNAQVSSHLKSTMELNIEALEKPYMVTYTNDYNGKHYNNTYSVVGVARNPITEGSFEDFNSILNASTSKDLKEELEEEVESVI